MRNIDGWETLSQLIEPMTLDLVAEKKALRMFGDRRKTIPTAFATRPKILVIISSRQAFRSGCFV